MEENWERYTQLIIHLINFLSPGYWSSRVFFLSQVPHSCFLYNYSFWTKHFWGLYQKYYFETEYNSGRSTAFLFDGSASEVGYHE